jgi:hypothetical protein
MTKAMSAMFRSKTSPELTIVIKPITEQYFPGVGLRRDVKSGEHAQFHNYLFLAEGKKLIDFLVNHSGFEVEYMPDPLDPTGYWKETGYFTEKTKTYLSPTERHEKILGEAQEAIGPIVASCRTSDNTGVPLKK